MCRGVFISRFPSNLPSPFNIPLVLSYREQSDGTGRSALGAYWYVSYPKPYQVATIYRLSTLSSLATPIPQVEGYRALTLGVHTKLDHMASPRTSDLVTNKPLPRVSETGRVPFRGMQIIILSYSTVLHEGIYPDGLTVLPVLGSPGLQANVGRRGKLVTSATTWNTPLYLKSSITFRSQYRGDGDRWRGKRPQRHLGTAGT